MPEPAVDPPHALRRRQRLAARAALYTGLATTAITAAALLPWIDQQVRLPPAPEWMGVDFEEDESVQLLQRLVRIDTTPGSGGEVAAAELVAEELRRVGVEPVIEVLDGDKANVWGVLEGERSEALVLHSHLDTDPVSEPEEWIHPPFGGEIEGPWIYGRGAFDMKSVLVAQLRAVADVAGAVERTGVRPARSLILLATSSEETGSDLGSRWIVDGHPELVARFWALITEGGVVEAADRDRIKYWGIAFGQKRFAVLEACAADRERLERLRDDLLGNQGTRPQLIPEVERFLRQYGPSRDELFLRWALSNPTVVLEDPELFRRLPPYAQALFRNEVHTFTIVERPGGGFVMPIVLHLLPGADVGTVRTELLPDWATAGVALSAPTRPATRPTSPLEHPAYLALRDTVRETYPSARVGPYFLSFFDNDARFYRSAGVPSYGFSPWLAHSPDSLTVSGPEERIALPLLVEGIELYGSFVRRAIGLDSGPAPRRHE